MAEYDEQQVTRYEMSAEDRQRVTRLVEEIAGRLEELARIGARVTGMSLSDGVIRKFSPLPATTEALKGHPTDIEIVCAPEGSACACIVLMDDGQHFWERPCGSGHH